MQNAPLAHDYFRGALPLWPFGPFTPGYLQEDDRRGHGPVSHSKPVTGKAGKGRGQKANPSQPTVSLAIPLAYAIKGLRSCVATILLRRTAPLTTQAPLLS